MSNQLPAKPNEVTSNAMTVRELNTGRDADISELRELFTGISGNLLFVQTGDYVVFKGIALKTKEDADGMYASGWTHQIKTYAAELGDESNPDIVRKSYSGDTIWNVEWLEAHFPTIRERAKQAKQKKNFW